ncbi:MAG: RIP metalloprotease RseP [Chitinophagales bacterium]|nr:RIP metalloprotease RseP [Chitinophagales bacterium]MDW8419057.1 RIP metalloprotease RseP [Chitinophagales bacterium]
MIRILYLFLGLSVLITLHELGHFLAARIFKTRVERFYLFFDFLFPFPNILNFSILRKKIGDTEYGLGWFPFGGYVKIAGMLDESQDESYKNSPPQPWEFRSKPAWQKLIIVLGGIVVNLLLGFFIFSMLLWANGERYIPIENARYGFAMDSLAKSIGLQSGDKLIGYDNKTFRDALVPVVKDLLLDDARVLHIERAGKKIDIPIPEHVYEAILQSEGKIMFTRLAIPNDIDTVLPGSPLQGIAQNGDKLIFINNEKIEYFPEITMTLLRFLGSEVTVGLLRGNDTITHRVTLPAEMPEEGILKLGARSPEDYLEVKRTEYNLFTAIPAGIVKSFQILSDYIKQFRIIFSPRLKGYKQIGGFAAISKLYPNRWDWTAFWTSTALLSLILAFMNFLPIPVLDGGYALFALWEMVTGKAPGERFLQYAHTVGMVLVLALLIYANGNDLVRWLSKYFI